MDAIQVGLGERSYPIYIASHTLNRLGSICLEHKLGRKAAVVTNPTIGAHYLQPVEESLVSAGFSVCRIEIPDGEIYKNSETLNFIYDKLIDGGLDRGSFIVALGGGVIGDMAGYAAATYLRGIPFVQVPTTLLAQVDSSVGGKTGINHPLGKNLIGAFYQPKLVLMDLTVLDTLSDRQYISGLAEMAKYGIVLDAQFFHFMEANADKLLHRDKACLQQATKTACLLKASVVERDEREGGLRAVLNYGHTIGHAVETLTDYRQFLHGEAVAIGMAQAAQISEEMGFSSPECTKSICCLLAALQLPTNLPPFKTDQYLAAIFHDKKMKDGGLSFVFNKDIGNFAIDKVKDVSRLLKVCGVGD
ncbi:3-dehydroquinate synthase [Geotalea sp. SG265]|uniref:3-dehydroquinate synthase n=1 Tax=Geotalea sp. SG265 TaxID=2922867 RepID=UPI001FB00035|nr:3-dehydroquinate synthase [Geotalea sp. SG265]